MNAVFTIIWTILYQYSAGRIKKPNRPYMARGPQFAHAWYRAYTRSRLTPQSVPFADLSTLGPVIVCGVRFYRFVPASCKRKSYTQEKLCGYNPYLPRVNRVLLCSLSHLQAHITCPRLTTSEYLFVLFPVLQPYLRLETKREANQLKCQSDVYLTV